MEERKEGEGEREGGREEGGIEGEGGTCMRNMPC